MLISLLELLSNNFRPCSPCLGKCSVKNATLRVRIGRLNLAPGDEGTRGNGNKNRARIGSLLPTSFRGENYVLRMQFQRKGAKKRKGAKILQFKNSEILC